MLEMHLHFRLPPENQRPCSPRTIVFCPCLYTRRGSDTNLDASATTFCEDFLASGQELVDWVVTSPPYKKAINFVKAAMSVAKYGVALKLPLSFLEPCSDRGTCLQENPLSACIFLRRATHTPAHALVGEFWGLVQSSGQCKVYTACFLPLKRPTVLRVVRKTLFRSNRGRCSRKAITGARKD